MSDSNLFRAYEELVKRARVIESASARHTPYAEPEFRQSYCRTAIAPNKRQLMAPAARPRIVISYDPKKLSDAEKLISNYRQIIDLHWLWSSGYVPSRCPVARWRPIFDSNKFNYELAWLFVIRLGKVDLKVEKLDLGVAVLGLARCKADTAIADYGRGYAMPARWRGWLSQVTWPS